MTSLILFPTVFISTETGRKLENPRQGAIYAITVCCKSGAGPVIALNTVTILVEDNAIMKIAVTSQNRTTVTDYAGQCRKFWIFETEYASVVEKHLVELPMRRLAKSVHPLDDVNVLITGGMASGLRYQLKQRGIQAVSTLESDPERAVTAWLNGTLDEMPPLNHIGQRCADHH